MIDYGNGMIFPDSWAYGPPDPPEGPEEAMGYRLFVSTDRCTLVRVWDSGEVEVCTRESEGAIWGPGVFLTEEKS